MLSDTEFLAMLAVEVGKPGESRASIGRRMGYSRTTVSLILDGKYLGQLDKVKSAFERLILEPRWYCPRIAGEIDQTHCTRLRQEQAPLHNPQKMRLWQQCQNCSHNPACLRRSA